MNVNIHELVKKVLAKGIVHIGASTFQELELYKSLGFNNRVWIEGDNNIPNTSGEFCLYGYVGSDFDKCETYIASNNGESSSLLKPWLHIEKYPEITFTKGQIAVVNPTYFYLNYVKEIENYNYLLLDIQGMELNALKGLGKYAKHFEVIVTECYFEELYLNCGKLQDITDYLQDYQLIEFKEESGKGWGDAAFIRKDLL